MVKYEIKVEYFPDGFSISDINCVTLSLAHGLGAYKREDYYAYCFLHSLFNLYEKIDRTKDEYFQNSLGYVSEFFNGSEDLEKYGFQKAVENFLIKHLSAGRPVFFFTNYTNMFYSVGYREPNQHGHTVMVCGYDSDKQLVWFQDDILMYQTERPRGDIFYRFPVPFNVFLQILLDNVTYYKKTENEYLSSNLFALYHSNKDVDAKTVCLSELKGFMNDTVHVLRPKDVPIDLDDDQKVWISQLYWGKYYIITHYLLRFLQSDETTLKAVEKLLNHVQIHVRYCQKLMLANTVSEDENMCEREKMMQQMWQECLAVFKLYLIEKLRE